VLQEGTIATHDERMRMEITEIFWAWNNREYINGISSMLHKKKKKTWVPKASQWAHWIHTTILLRKKRNAPVHCQTSTTKQCRGKLRFPLWKTCLFPINWISVYNLHKWHGRVRDMMNIHYWRHWWNPQEKKLKKEKVTYFAVSRVNNMWSLITTRYVTSDNLGSACFLELFNLLFTLVFLSPHNWFPEITFRSSGNVNSCLLPSKISDSELL
jgi:hypothetical protein